MSTLPRCRELLLVTLLLTYGAADAVQDHIIICEDRQKLTLDSCRSVKLGEEGEVTSNQLFFRLRGTCLGRPGDKGVPRCVPIHLEDASSRLPIPEARLELGWAAAGTYRTAVLKVNDATGVIQIPGWVGTILLESKGYEDRRLEPGKLELDTVRLRPGRMVLVSCAHDDPTRSWTAEMTLEGIDIDHKIDRRLKNNEQISLGSIPLARYMLDITGDGLAPTHEQIIIPQGDAPFELKPVLTEGLCITLPFETVPRLTKVGYRLNQYKPNQFPTLYMEGTLTLPAVDPDGLRRAELCGLTPGRFEIELDGPRVATSFHSFELPADGNGYSAIPIHLAEAGSAWLEVLDEVNQPVAGATIFLGWSDDSGGQGIRRTTDANGKVLLPSFEVPKEIGIDVRAQGYRRLIARSSSIQSRTVTLEPIGHLTGEIGDGTCPQENLRLTVEEPCNYQDSCWMPVVQHFIDDCTVHEPIEHPGDYQVTITSSSFRRYQKLISIDDSLEYDLGTIQLEPGLHLDILVRSHRGDPVSGAAVTIEGLTSPQLSGDDGWVRFSTLDEDAENVVILASDSDHAPFRQSFSIPDERSLTIELMLPGVIYGQVLREDGSPASGETMTAIGPTKPQIATIGHDGCYRFEKLAPGRWQLDHNEVIASRAGVRQSTAHRKSVVLAAGQELEVSFRPMLQIHGRIEVDGQAAAAVSVTARHDNESEMVRIRSNDLGQYDAMLPRTGLWMFRYQGAEAQVMVTGPCPCLIDIGFNIVSRGLR
jgi:hypothetical protein